MGSTPTFNADKVVPWESFLHYFFEQDTIRIIVSEARDEVVVEDAGRTTGTGEAQSRETSTVVKLRRGEGILLAVPTEWTLCPLPNPSSIPQSLERTTGRVRDGSRSR